MTTTKRAYKLRILFHLFYLFFAFSGKCGFDPSERLIFSQSLVYYAGKCGDIPLSLLGSSGWRIKIASSFSIDLLLIS